MYRLVALQSRLLEFVLLNCPSIAKEAKEVKLFLVKIFKQNGSHATRYTQEAFSTILMHPLYSEEQIESEDVAIFRTPEFFRTLSEILAPQ